MAFPTTSGVAQSAPRQWSPVPSFKHSIGQAFGHVLNALPGHSTLGSNITNPAVNYRGAPNPYSSLNPRPSSAWVPYANPSVNGNNGGQVQSLQTYDGAASADPYAAWGGRSAYDSLRSGFASQKSNIYGTANEAASSQGLGLQGNILDFIDSLRSGQQKLNTEGTNNELAFRQGREGVMGMVGRGIQSGGVLLGNKNAVDSSAAGAIARAYGNLGQRQLSSVGNQYELANNNLQQGQADLETQRASGIRHIQDAKTQAVNNLVLDARNKFAALDASIAQASLPDRINIEQEKENVRQDVLGKLAYLDQSLAGQSSVQPSTLEQRRTEATRLAGLGQAPTDSFNFTDQAPAQFQGGGLPSELPLFTAPRRRTA